MTRLHLIDALTPQFRFKRYADQRRGGWFCAAESICRPPSEDGGRWSFVWFSSASTNVDIYPHCNTHRWLGQNRCRRPAAGYDQCGAGGRKSRFCRQNDFMVPACGGGAAACRCWAAAAHASRHVAQARCEQRLGIVPGAWAKSSATEQTRHQDPLDRPRIRRREPVGIIAEVLGVDALELNREISHAAIVGGVEPVGLAAGRRADLNDLDIDALQAVDDGFAGGTRAERRSARKPASNSRWAELGPRSRKIPGSSYESRVV